MNNTIDLTTLTIEQLEVIAFANITDYCDFNGCTVRLKSFDQIDRKKLIAVREFSQSEGEAKVKLQDKVLALKLLGEHLGIFSEFNMAIAALRKYGIELVQNPDNSWEVKAIDKTMGEEI